MVFPIPQPRGGTIFDEEVGLFSTSISNWPTDDDHTYVDFIREKASDRTGLATDYRLTEKWTSSAKSVFLFDVQGSVAKSTHAGIPWLRRIKKEIGKRIHFWPFDGWKVPEGRSVIVEIYPSLVRNRYPKDGRTKDQQDAYAINRWLAEMDRNGFLGRYKSTCKPRFWGLPMLEIPDNFDVLGRNQDFPAAPSLPRFFAGERLHPERTAKFTAIEPR